MNKPNYFRALIWFVYIFISNLVCLALDEIVDSNPLVSVRTVDSIDAIVVNHIRPPPTAIFGESQIDNIRGCKYPAYSLFLLET